MNEKCIDCGCELIHDPSDACAGYYTAYGSGPYCEADRDYWQDVDNENERRSERDLDLEARLCDCCD